MTSTQQGCGFNPAGDATPCDHVVSHYYDGEDVGEYFFHASHYGRGYHFPSPPGYEKRFKFCPECGADLAAFWKGKGSE